MPRTARDAAPRSAWRLFAVFAVASLVPVVVLGLVLAASYRSEASGRGLAEARAQARLFGRTAIEPRLVGVDTGGPLQAADVAALDEMSRSAVVAGDIVRFRIRTLTGRVIYSNDRSRSAPDDEEALAAARGRTVAEITHLNADEDGDGAIERDIRAAEVYLPLTDGRSTRPVAVLELYLPYDPIARDIAAGLHALYRDLALGLAALYLVLAGISWSVTSRLRRLAARNGHLAAHDQLTELPNRRSFQTRLETALASGERHGRETVIAIVNLDRFKEVNDTLGPGNGDALLVEVGRRLRTVLDGHDYLARLGGDEFAVIFSSAEPAAVERGVQEMQRALLQRMDLAGIPVEVEATVVLATAPRDGDRAETLLQHADAATDVAKRSGTAVVRYDASQDPYDPTRLALIGDLRRAVREDELVLHFQPKIDVRTGVVESVEALLRWQHPERGLLMPDEFIPVVEQTGMINVLTDWVLDAALAWVVGVRRTAPSMRVAVNVSARNLIRPEFATDVADALARRGCDVDCLTVEVTETALVADPARVEASLRRLATSGVRVSVDDFGRGQTSLSQLATLPLHEVKIDKSFVMDMGDVEAHASIVQSVVDLAHRLGFHVVAEGVESPSILDALRLAGCDVAQGYHIARPMPAAQLRDWWAEHDAARFCPPRPMSAVGGRHRRI